MSGGGDEERPPLGTEGAQENGDRDPCKVTGSIGGTGTARYGEALMRGDTAAAVQFLQGWAPAGPWVLTSIVPDGGKTDTATFTAAEVPKMRDWIEERQGVQNVYFTVNRTFRAMTVKPKKTDIAATRAYHVDVDPRVGEDVEAERARAIELLRAYDPAPTVIIDSGGGAQGFWLLESEDAPAGEPGDETRHLPTEERNLTIETALQADACHNVDRIMRLPGTVNVPGDKKRKKGRVARVASVVEVDWTRRYRPGQFRRTPKVLASAGNPAAGGRVAVTAAPAMGLDLNTLPPGVSDRIRAMIVQGEDVNDPGRYPSRSEAFWAVMCMMVRAGCTDEQMLGVSLDPDYKISGHVLDQPRPENYAREQVEKARVEAAGDPKLTDMNARHAFLSHEGGKVRVCEFAYELEDPNEVDPERQRRRWVTYLQSATDFKATHNNRYVEFKNKDKEAVFKPLGDVWLGWEHRRQHRALTFNPSAGELVGDKLNLWRGFPVKPKAGDWGLFKAHILHVMAAGDEEVADYIIRWLALAVQRPAEPAGVALVFKGGRGSGKGLFAHIARDLFGQHSYYLPGAAALTGKFNAHFRDTVLVYADEVKWNGNKNAESLLQAMITERELLIEGKYKDTVLSRNCLHLIMTSNDDWVVPAAIDERRFAVFRTDDTKRGNKAYFKAIAAQMKGEGLAAMLHDLVAMDLTGWDAMVNMPASPELTQQKLEGLSGPNRLVWEMLMQGCAPGGRYPSVKIGKDTHHHSNPAVVLEDVIAWGIRQNLIRDAVSSQRMSDAVKRLGIKRTQPYLEGRQQWAWVLPSLAEARAAWAASLGLVGIEWPEGDEWLAFNPDT